MGLSREQQWRSLPKVEVLAPFSRVYREAVVLDVNAELQQLKVRFVDESALLEIDYDQLPTAVCSKSNSPARTSAPSTRSSPRSLCSPTDETNPEISPKVAPVVGTTEDQWVPQSCVYHQQIQDDVYDHSFSALTNPTLVHGFERQESLGSSFSDTPVTLPQVGDAVEAHCLEQTGWGGWWEGGVVAVNPESRMCLIEFADGTRETVDGNRVRVSSGRHHAVYAKRSIMVPESFRADLIDTQDALLDLASLIGIHVLDLSLPYANTITVVGPSDSMETIQTMINAHLRRMQEVARLVSLGRAIAVDIQVSRRNHLHGKHRVAFEVEQDVIGSCIGKAGSNLKRAQALPGITGVLVTECGPGRHKIEIAATSPEIAESARQIIEHVRARLPVAAIEIGQLIGKRGIHLRSIERSARVSKFVLVDSEPKSSAPERCVYFETVGPRKNVDLAVSLFKSWQAHVANVRDLEMNVRRLRMEAGSLHLANSLSKYQQPPTSPMTTTSPMNHAEGGSASTRRQSEKVGGPPAISLPENLHKH